MKQFPRFIAGCLLLWNLIAAGAAERPPNILIMLADDLGYSDLGVYGSSFYETPHLDALARQGAQFTDAYAACPVCSPTRASLMTGKWPQRTGVTDYIGAAQPGEWKRNTRLLPAPYQTELSLEEQTLAEALKKAGYSTFFAGKWHLGPEGRWPEDQGFDVNKGGIDRGGPYGGRKYFSPYGNPRLEDGPAGEHLPDRLAEETVRFMRKNQDRPFLAVLSFYSVHTPLLAREDLRQKYQEKRERLGLETKWGREGERDVRLVQIHPVYAAMVEAMDLAAGKVLKGIKELGLNDNTIVIFTSDNGGLSTSEGWPTSNLPFRGGKGWLYEGGIRVPLIIRWPGVTRRGSRIAEPVITPDIFKTVIAAAGARSGDFVNGIDLRPVIAGKRELPRALFWHYPHYGNQGGAPGGAIRLGEWKLVEWFEDGRVELFYLKEDPGEHFDLSGLQPERTARLLEDLRAWRQEVGAKMPAPNPNYNPAKPSGRGSSPPQELRDGNGAQ